MNWFYQLMSEKKARPEAQAGLFSNN